MALCRPQYNDPLQQKMLNQVRGMYEHMDKNDIKVPSIMRYQSFRASNIAGVKLDPSICIGREVNVSMEELKKFKL